MFGSSKTKVQRLNKRRKSGQDRKKKLAKDGTTPPFAIDPKKAKASS
ncbi:MAG: hypothetical protein GXP55_13390 [Deltaproteobacteria bacterium]|nr:hypothetical protein [Deltaproteobacteria bacterium]